MKLGEGVSISRYSDSQLVRIESNDTLKCSALYIHVHNLNSMTVTSPCFLSQQYRIREMRGSAQGDTANERQSGVQSRRVSPKPCTAGLNHSSLNSAPSLGPGQGSGQAVDFHPLSPQMCPRKAICFLPGVGGSGQWTVMGCLRQSFRQLLKKG